MIQWIYKDKIVSELPDNTYGFIYQIDYEDNTSYIGKKQCYSKVQLPALKNGTVRSEAICRIGKNINNKRVQFDVLYKETSWRTYKGSSEITKGKVIKNKIILAFCKSKRELTYMECKALFCLDAIEDGKYLNINILGKFYRDNLI